MCPSSTFVQSPAIPKLTCSICKKYLSHFPIYSHSKLGSVCGRCNIDDKKDYTRNEIYEEIAQFQKFPCIFINSGCLENLLPSEVPRHERLCKFKKIDCPTRIFNNCDWQGFTTELLDHFEVKHPTFILKDGHFEIDFINNHKENYLLSFCEELFVVTREANIKSNLFSCVVTYIGNNTIAEDYVFDLVLESGNRMHKHKITEKLNKKVELHGDTIRGILNDPTNIIAHIDVREEKCDTITPENDSDNKVDYEELRDLECPVCFEYLIPPVFQCITGHSICGKCKSDVTECPTCRGEIKNTQNFTLEKFILKTTYPCKHEKCKFTAKSVELKRHEATCVYGPFKCPLHDSENCSQSMPITDIYDHVVKVHYENLLEFDTVNIPINENEPLEECYILRYSFRLFKLCFQFMDGTFSWSMQPIGPFEECFKYKFELDVIDNCGNKNRVYVKGPCAPYCESTVQSFLYDGSFIYLEYDQIRKLLSDQLTYRVRILQE